MGNVINLSLMKEPLNWLIVALMVMIAAVGLALILGHDGQGFVAATGSSAMNGNDGEPA